jgi:hypothetical protein
MSWSPCSETSRVVSDHYETPWGITPRDVLNDALGSHRATFTWQRHSSFSYDVEGRSTTLLVKIARRGRANFFKRDGSPNCPSMGPCFEFYRCSSTLVIPVHVQATTQDGAIKAQQDSELTVSARHNIELHLDQPFATHRGTLPIPKLREKTVSVPSLGISLGFSRKRTMAGAIRGFYEIENVGGRFAEYACFPDKRLREFRNSERAIGCRD